MKFWRALYKVVNQLNSLKANTEKECWNYWLDKLRVDFPNYKLIDYSDEVSFPKVGVIINAKGVDFAVCIEQETNIYYGIGRHECSETLLKEVAYMVAPILEEIGGFKSTSWWYDWKHTSFENGYERLKTLILEIEKTCMV